MASRHPVFTAAQVGGMMTLSLSSLGAMMILILVLMTMIH